MEVDAFAQSGDRPPASFVEGLPLADDRLEAVCQQGANRPALFGGYDACFSQQIGVEF
ncbi:MAG TPA: hypothetical protein VNR20_01605 [Terriglobales bacterium]|nr:hypothetical protein [Terriglobales bacterium]